MQPIQSRFRQFRRSKARILATRIPPSDGAWENAKPNLGHKALARLVEMGKCIGIITQNVDNLHQDSVYQMI